MTKTNQPNTKPKKPEGNADNYGIEKSVCHLELIRHADGRAHLELQRMPFVVIGRTTRYHCRLYGCA